MLLILTQEKISRNNQIGIPLGGGERKPKGDFIGIVSLSHVANEYNHQFWISYYPSGSISGGAKGYVKREIRYGQILEVELGKYTLWFRRIPETDNQWQVTIPQ